MRRRCTVSRRGRDWRAHLRWCTQRVWDLLRSTGVENLVDILFEGFPVHERVRIWRARFSDVCERLQLPVGAALEGDPSLEVGRITVAVALLRLQEAGGLALGWL